MRSRSSGCLVAQHYGTNAEAHVNPLRELLTFPAVIALLVALALRPVPIPNPVSDGLGLLASMVAPLIMLSVGLSLRASTIGAHRRTARRALGAEAVHRPRGGDRARMAAVWHRRAGR